MINLPIANGFHLGNLKIDCIESGGESYDKTSRCGPNRKEVGKYRS